MDNHYLLSVNNIIVEYFSSLMDAIENLYSSFRDIMDSINSSFTDIADNFHMSSDDSYLLFFAFLIILIILCVVLYVIVHQICSIHKRRVKSFVKNSSLRYQECQKLNEEYSSHFIAYQESYYHYVDVNTRHKVDMFDFDMGLKNLLSNNFEIDLDYINDCVTSNCYWYDKYTDAYENLPEFRTKEQFRAITGEKVHMTYKKYTEEEHKLEFPQLQPGLSFQVVITATYTSPQGYSHHEQSMVYSLEDCITCQSEIARAEQERNYREEERRKMTPALRYEVLKRDGFRCTICGRGKDDGIKLHVDHIQPVSKGGKTELSNLRTLCQDCNLGKSAQWDPDGIN